MNVFTLWLTGLSGAGKTTLANAVKTNFKSLVILDGDEMRKSLNKDLGYDDASRSENIRRLAEVARLFNLNGHPVIVAAISPFEKDRQLAKSIIGDDLFRLCFVRCSLSKCESRDVKGLYAKARSNKISQFTGIDSVYEIPKYPDILIDTEFSSISECVSIILDGLAEYHI